MSSARDEFDRTPHRASEGSAPLHRAVSDDDEPTRGASHPIGCGRFAREALEVLAVSRFDRDVVADERLEAHVVVCTDCANALQELERELGEADAFLGEFKTVASVSATTSQRVPVASGDDGPIRGYQLGTEIHRGGQGAVFHAEQIATRRPCAVKMLLGGKFASDKQRLRFEREVEVVAKMRHPSIVTLYESGIATTGEPWFAMEFIAGERLDEFVRAKCSSARLLGALFKGVAEAVAYAHRRGVIHRDLKPGNILVDREGTPRILDFGLARLDDASRHGDIDGGTTAAGEFLGTFAYAAPEQLSGDPSLVDSRCDLYALGVVLFECLVGQKPFSGAKSIAELVTQKTMSSPPRPRSLVSSVDPDLEVIALRLLAADPARRYDTADALVEDLARFLDGRPILAREDSVAYVVRKTLRRHWIPASFAALLVMTVFVSAIALFVAYRNAERERERSERTLASFQKALGSANPETGSGSSSMGIEDFLGLVEQQVTAELGDEPYQLAGVLRTLGLIHLGFDDAERAKSAIEEAHRVQEDGWERGEVSAAQFAETEFALARLRFNLRDFVGAEACYRRALALREAALGPDDVDTVETLRQLASALRAQNRLEDAQAVLDDAWLRSAKFPDTQAARVIRVGLLHGRATLSAARNDAASAIVQYEEALAALLQMVPADDWRVGRTRYNLARMQLRTGALEAALENAAAAERILREKKGADATMTREAASLCETVRKISVDGDG